MKLTVNGDTLTLNGNTIADLVSQLELTGRRLAVEVNREIIPKSQHSDFALNEDDVVEIVHAIGGQSVPVGSPNQQWYCHLV